MQFNIIFKTIFQYIHKKFRFVHTNTFCKYRKKLRASPRVHLVIVCTAYVVKFDSTVAKTGTTQIIRRGHIQNHNIFIIIIILL